MSECNHVREKLGLETRCCSSCHAYLSEGGGCLPSSATVNGERYEVCCEIADAAKLMTSRPPAALPGRAGKP